MKILKFVVGAEIIITAVGEETVGEETVRELAILAVERALNTPPHPPDNTLKVKINVDPTKAPSHPNDITRLPPLDMSIHHRVHIKEDLGKEDPKS